MVFRFLLETDVVSRFNMCGTEWNVCFIGFLGFQLPLSTIWVGFLRKCSV